MTDDIVTRLREECAHSAAAKTLPSWHFAAVVWEAANEIERLRDEIKAFVHEAEKIKRLEAQVKAAHKILASESFGWLVIGSNHELSHWEMLSPYIDAYWDTYGTYFRPKPDNIG